MVYHPCFALFCVLLVESHEIFADVYLYFTLLRCVVTRVKCVNIVLNIVLHPQNNKHFLILRKYFVIFWAHRTWPTCVGTCIVRGHLPTYMGLRPRYMGGAHVHRTHLTRLRRIRLLPMILGEAHSCPRRGQRAEGP